MNEHQIKDLNLLYYEFSTLELMKKAGVGCARHIKGKNIAIFCGKGNNGGDGFVAALSLMKKVPVTVYLLCDPKDIRSSAARFYWKELTKASCKNLTIEIIKTPRQVAKIRSVHDTYVDAMLGVGLTKAPREPYTSVIRYINRRSGGKIAVDIPSGYGTKCAFKANRVLSIHVRKCPLPTTVIDIGIHHKYDFYTGYGDVIALHGRDSNSRKGNNGKVLVIAGSTTYHGAAVYCSEATSYFVDLVYVATDPINVPVFKKSSPEFIVAGFNEIKFTQSFLKRFDCILIGPGIAKSEEMKSICEKVLTSNVKCVLDATALSLINPKMLHNKCIVTPHAAEFKKLFGCVGNEKNVLRMAQKYGCVVVKKGKVDLISDGSDVYKNFSGNAGMTTGGTGDILVGIITGFFAKNEALDSAQAGTFLCGYTGDFYKGTLFNAQRMLTVLPQRYLEIMMKNQ